MEVVGVALSKGALSSSRLYFCITVYNCMNRIFNGNHCRHLHSEHAVGFQSALHAFETCACTTQSIFSMSWTWRETSDPKERRGWQRKVRCLQPQLDRGCSYLTCVFWLLPPHQITDTISSPAPPIAASKSRNLVHLRTWKKTVRSISAAKAFNWGSVSKRWPWWGTTPAGLWTGSWHTVIILL